MTAKRIGARRLSLSNDFVSLDLSDYGSLLQFTDHSAPGGGETWIQSGMGGSPIFTLRGVKPGENPNKFYESPRGLQLNARDFRRCRYRVIKRDGRTGWEFTYRGASFEGQGALSVKVTVTLAEDSPLSEWRISYSNTGRTPLQEIRFPEVGGMGSSVPDAAETEYVVKPVYSGIKTMKPRENGVCGQGQAEYPGSGMSVQLFPCCDGQGGVFYFAVHDADNYRKMAEVRYEGSKKSFRISTIHMAAEAAAPGKWEVPYPVVLGAFRGDWYDAAKVYRKWASAQPQWSRKLAERKDIPKWFMEMPLWLQGNCWSTDEAEFMGFAQRIADFRKAVGVPLAFHWYIWHKWLKFDTCYPDYTPSRPYFKEAVELCHQADVKVIPYINIQLCDVNLPMWKNLENSARRMPDGTLYNYGPRTGDYKGIINTHTGDADVFAGREDAKRLLVPMCLNSQPWRETVLQQARNVLADANVDGIYWDETYCYVALCHDRRHGHWLGGSDHADAVKEIHRITHGMRDEYVPTLGENMGENYLDTCDALLNAHSDVDFDNVPLFQSIHSDRAIEVGLFISQVDWPKPDTWRSKLAFNLIRGRSIGWLNTDQKILNMTQPQYAEAMKILNAFCVARIAGHPWLLYGEMLRAPELTGINEIAVKWYMRSSGKMEEQKMPAVIASCYRAPDGRVGLILCNVTTSPQQPVVVWNERDWGKITANPTEWSSADRKWKNANIPDGKISMSPGEIRIIAYPAE